jgi:hypothetical protein
MLRRLLFYYSDGIASVEGVAGVDVDDDIEPRSGDSVNSFVSGGNTAVVDGGGGGGGGSGVIAPLQSDVGYG